MSLDTYVERYRKELFESVLPFWMEHSIDRDFGGYFTCLDRAGGVYDTRKYVWLQGRAVWMFARLYNEVEAKPEWLEAARSGAEFLQRYSLDPGGRCYFSLTREGRPVFFQRKPYAAVFTALGFLEYARASGEKNYQETAIELFWRIQTWIEYPGMLGRPQLEGQAPGSQLADVMVTAMLALEFYRALKDRRDYQVLVDAIDKAMLHADRDRHVFVENVPPNGAKLYDSPDNRLCCPGHSLEVTWFMLQALQVHPDASLQEELLQFLEGSLEFGWDAEYGGIHYFVDVAGRPPLLLEAPMKLWWSHTEAIYATILAYTLTGEEKWLRWLEKVDEYAFDKFADPEHGEWFGYCDRRGNLTNECKGNNYKGMYHTPRFLLYSIQAAEGGARRMTAEV